MIKVIVKRVSINRLIHTCVSFLEGTKNETPKGFYHWWFFWIHNSNKFIKRVCHTTDLNNRINDSEEGVAFTWVIVTCSDEMKFIINFATITEHTKSADGLAPLCNREFVDTVMSTADRKSSSIPKNFWMQSLYMSLYCITWIYLFVKNFNGIRIQYLTHWILNKKRRWQNDI